MRAIRTTTISILAIGLLAGSMVGVAAQDEADPAAPVAFEGQWGCDVDISPLAAFENGDVASLAVSVALPVLKVNDPRLDGVTTWSAIRSTWGPDPDSPAVDGVPLFGELSTNVTTVRIETEGGAWQGGFTDASVGEQGLRGPLVLVGEREYEGFSVIMDPQFSAIENSECGGWNVQGFIVEGGMPSAPEAGEAVPAAE